MVFSMATNRADALLQSPGKKRGNGKETGRLSGITFNAGGLIALERTSSMPMWRFAQRTEQVVVTSDPRDIGRIDVELRSVTV